MEKVSALHYPDLTSQIDMTWHPSVGLSRLDNDAELMSEIVDLLEIALRERLEDMQECATHLDFKSLRYHTHYQLPSLKMLGFDHQAKVFEAFESAVVMSDELACQRLTPVVRDMWLSTIESLSKYRRTAGH
jgi:hypothetical protein